jgi:excisionase family DNA binding protein
VTLRDVMTRLGVSRKTALSLRGPLRGYQVGRQWRFDAADVDAFVDAQKAAATPAPRHRAPMPPPAKRSNTAGVTWKGAERYT